MSRGAGGAPFELKGTQALMRKEGDSLVITPLHRPRLLALLARWEPIVEDLATAEDLPVQERESF